MGMDFLGGALSGGIMSGSNVAINGANVQTESLVSNEVADKLLNDRTSVAFLKKHGNLNLQKGMTKEQKREAVRQAVENVVHKEKTDVGGEGSLDTTGDERYDESKKTVSGGLTDGGEEAGFDGGEKASNPRDGGEVLWRKENVRQTGSRSTVEQGSAFVESVTEGRFFCHTKRRYPTKV